MSDNFWNRPARLLRARAVVAFGEGAVPLGAPIAEADLGTIARQVRTISDDDLIYHVVLTDDEHYRTAESLRELISRDDLPER